MRRLVFELVRSFFYRTVMSDGEALRARGFRPIDPGDKREFLASRAEAYGYEIVHTAEAVWIRKTFRRSGQEAPLAIRKGPRWDARTLRTEYASQGPGQPNLAGGCTHD